MKSDTPQWRWLEKGLADQVITNFCREKSISVIQRDTMQRVAEQMNWTPEMILDARRLEQIRKALEPKYLISGVYEVKAGKLTITAIIVDFEAKKEVARREVSGPAEVARREVSGPAGDALKLTRKLSASLISWLTKRPEEKILGELPAWTRSIPAAKALYKGLHFYDQGRYPEAWLSFRRASREDREWAEAQYWVGKIYYLMSRFEHAQRVYERFLRKARYHRRAVDAALEYVHACEKADVPLEKLLAAYRDIWTKFPEERISYSPYHDRPLGSELRRSAAMALADAGRYGQAVETLEAYEDEWAKIFMYKHRRLTGQTLPLEQLRRHDLFPRRAILVQKTQEGVGFQSICGLFTFERKRGKAAAVLSLEGDGGKLNRGPAVTAAKTDCCHIVADSGYVFELLRLSLETPATKGSVTFRLGRDRPGDFLEKTEDLSRALRDGVVFDNLPPASILHIECVAKTETQVELPWDLIQKFRIDQVELRELGAAGSIDVACTNAFDYRVEVEGYFGRESCGLIGELPAGEHTVRISPLAGQETFDGLVCSVTVRPGQTTFLRPSLPYKPNGPLAGWSGGATAERTPGPNTGRRSGDGWLCLLLDEDKMRTLWTCAGDIWLASSADGRTFSKPQRLPPPISTGWSEFFLKCLRDEKGRYVLLFCSNRDYPHHNRLYMSWSRDLKHWSAPTLAKGLEGFNSCDIILDKSGRYLLVSNRGLCVHASRDAITWKRLTREEAQIKCGQIAFLQRDDGTYEAIVTEYAQDDKPARIWRYTTTDCERWSRGSVLYTFGPGEPSVDVSAVHRKGQTQIGVCYRIGKSKNLFIIRQAGRDTWECSQTVAGLGAYGFCLAHHPTWGYALALYKRGKIPFLSVPPGLRASGPKVIHGPSLDGFRYSRIEQQPPPVATPKEPPEPQPPPEADLEVGRLRFTAQDTECRTSSLVRLVGYQNFTGPPAGSTKFSSRARIAAINSAGFEYHVALDWPNETFRYPDKLYVDFSGKGDFEQAILLKPTGTVWYAGDETKSEFCYEAIDVPRHGRTYPAFFKAGYFTARGFEKLLVRLGTVAEGLCAFGDETYRIRILDANGNLCFNDPVKPRLEGGAFKRFGPGDFMWVRDKAASQDDEAIAKACYGQPVCVGGVLYNVEVSKDGTTVKASRLKNATAKIKIDKPMWQAWLLGSEHFFMVSGTNEPILVPPGRYYLSAYREIYQLSPEERLLIEPMQDKSYCTGKLIFIDVRPGRLNEIAVGAPLKCVLKVRQDKRMVRIYLDVLDADGRGLYPVGTESRHGKGWVSLGAKMPKIIIRDSAGKVVEEFKEKYRSWEESDSYSLFEWRLHDGAKGKYTADLKWDLGLKGLVLPLKPTSFSVH
jgi:tetratricopeptide (TPR) repeat protein